MPAQSASYSSSVRTSLRYGVTPVAAIPARVQLFVSEYAIPAIHPKITEVCFPCDKLLNQIRVDPVPNIDCTTNAGISKANSVENASESGRVESIVASIGPVSGATSPVAYNDSASTLVFDASSTTGSSESGYAWECVVAAAVASIVGCIAAKSARTGSGNRTPFIASESANAAE